MKQIETQKMNPIEAGEPEIEVYFTEAELKTAQIGEIIEPVGDFYPEEIDEKEPETDYMR